jgi:protein-tyrosine phosphatase
MAVALAGGSGSGAGASAANSMGPMVVPGVGLSNFGVVDGRIYRGEQPKRDDFTALKAFGIATIVDLRLDARKESRAEAEAAGLKYVNIPIDGHAQPSDADVAAFLQVLEQARGEKVYVHCAGGRHRTGSMIAVYRMVKDGWSIDQAYEEMLAYDFYTRNGHKGFKTYVYDYWERMRQAPGSVPAAFCPPAQQAVAAE